VADLVADPSKIRIRRSRPADREAALALAPRLAEDAAPWRERGVVLAAVCG
jgi:hypothetical protein